jgi:hypothetical protein
MSDGRFAFPCHARQPQDARHVFTRATDPALDVGQNVFPSAWETILGGIPTGTTHIFHAVDVLILG